LVEHHGVRRLTETSEQLSSTYINWFKYFWLYM